MKIRFRSYHPPLMCVDLQVLCSPVLFVSSHHWWLSFCSRRGILPHSHTGCSCWCPALHISPPALDRLPPAGLHWQCMLPYTLELQKQLDVNCRKNTLWNELWKSCLRFSLRNALHSSSDVHMPVKPVNLGVCREYLTAKITKCI